MEMMKRTRLFQTLFWLILSSATRQAFESLNELIVFVLKQTQKTRAEVPTFGLQSITCTYTSTFCSRPRCSSQWSNFCVTWWGRYGRQKSVEILGQNSDCQGRQGKKGREKLKQRTMTLNLVLVQKVEAVSKKSFFYLSFPKFTMAWHG